MPKLLQAPLVFQYLDYRNFLKAVFDFRRESQKKSARALFQEAGFKSLGHFYMITGAKAHLDERKLEAVATAWGVAANQMPYLLKLREFCAVKSPTQKTLLYKELEQMRSALKVRLLSEADLALLSHWAAFPLLEALATRMRTSSLSSFAKALGLKVAQIEQLLSIYERLSLAVKDGQYYRRSSEAFEGYIERSSKAVRQMHSELIERAFQSIEKVPPDKRLLFTLSIPLQFRQLSEVKKAADDFFQHINREMDAGANADAVFQMNLQVFPILNKDDLDS